MKNVNLNNVLNGNTWLDSKPEFAEVGDTYYDTISGSILVYDGTGWVMIQSAKDKYKKINREEAIDELLENDEFEPEYFGFSGTNNSRKHIFKYENVTYEIMRDTVHSNFFTISESAYDGLVYYRGKIPTNKFALQLFMNMNFVFLPIVHREIKISDLLD